MGNGMKKWLIFLLSAGILLNVACSSKVVERPQNGMVLGFATEVKEFDPFSSLTADARSIIFNLFDGLVNVDTDGSFVPAIASAYEMSADAKTYTFTIRSGVYFHTGEELNGEDVLASVNRARSSGIAGYNKIESVFVNPQGKLVIELADADPGFIAYLTTPIVQKNPADLQKAPVGTGAYKLSEFIEGTSATLSRNELYWGQKAQIEHVTLRFYQKQADVVAAFKKGEIDGFSANADSVVSLKASEVNQYKRNSNSVQILALNNDFEPFKNAEIRKAVNYLVNEDEIIQEANFGYGVKVGSALIPALSKYYDPSLIGSYARNVGRAKELLAANGYKKGFKFTIVVPSSYSVHVQTAKIIARQLLAAGIKASVKQVDWETWLASVYRERQYEATIISLDGSLAYPTAYLARYVSTAGNNFINYTSVYYDEIYEKAVSATDEDSRISYFKTAQRILTDDCASVFIQDISTVTIYNKNFQGVKDYPLYVHDFSAIYRVQQEE